MLVVLGWGERKREMWSSLRAKMSQQAALGEQGGQLIVLLTLRV